MPSSASHPVTSLPLPRRAINALRAHPPPRPGAGITTLEEPRELPDAALLSLRQFGRAYLTAIRSLAVQYHDTEH
jgi:hypothetical protein